MRVPLPTALDPDVGPLETYLNDHLAGSTVGLDLCRRAAVEHEGTDLGAFLTRLADEIDEDRQALQEIMEGVGASADRIKVALAWAGEKGSRLKLMVLSSVSPLEELEMLMLGVSGKRALWRALLEIAPQEPRLPAARLDALHERADRQVSELEQRRISAAREALIDESRVPV